MNLLLDDRYRDYLTATQGDKTAAAILVLAEIAASALAPPLALSPPEGPPGLLTVAEAAQRLGLTSHEVYSECLAGRLRPTKIDNRIYLADHEIRRYQGAPP